VSAPNRLEVFASETSHFINLTYMMIKGVAFMYHPSPIPDESHVMDLPIDLESAVATALAEVAATEVIDLHTHLLPPSHGSSCRWGIDELLTYPYLVAEYFMTASASMTPEYFYGMTKQNQAGKIYSLTVRRYQKPVVG
jgi:hypothetical protein